MSLSVDVFLVGADGRREVLDVPDGCDDSAGFESWRTRVWGSEAVRSVGAAFFPVLTDADVQVQPEQVPALLRECALLSGNLGMIAASIDAGQTRTDYHDAVSDRLANVEDAARRALAVGGGVLIW
ncbi:hypothetical protein [Streptomyces sp. NPDC057287]|uniref:hypothetical protein n=1 Tax=Streptomyces sp. NPDC057287 TaxID=3346086 RepID=UPI00363DEC18